MTRNYTKIIDLTQDDDSTENTSCDLIIYVKELAKLSKPREAQKIPFMEKFFNDIELDICKNVNTTSHDVDPRIFKKRKYFLVNQKVITIIAYTA